MKISVSTTVWNNFRLEWMEKYAHMNRMGWFFFVAIFAVKYVFTADKHIILLFLALLLLIANQLVIVSYQKWETEKKKNEQRS